MRGPDWSIRKYKTDDGLWRAEVTSRDATVMEFGDAGEHEDWIQFMAWPAEAASPQLLFVLRYPGGADAPHYFDVIAPRENFRTVFDSGDGLNLDKVENADGGRPEFTMTSRHYRGLLDLPVSESAEPLLVFVYDEAAKQYICQNFRYTKMLGPIAEHHRQAFEAAHRSQELYNYRGDDARSREAATHLLRYLVQTVYMGQIDKAKGYLEAFVAPGTVALIQPAIEDRIATDPWFQQMRRAFERANQARHTITPDPQPVVVTQPAPVVVVAERKPSAWDRFWDSVALDGFVGYNGWSDDVYGGVGLSTWPSRYTRVGIGLSSGGPYCSGGFHYAGVRF
jgi:hypothetical protein